VVVFDSVVMRKFVAVLVLLAAAGCHREARISDGPIIIISIDTLRSDHLPAYGYKSVATPAIDALRADSILYSRAYSHSPLTLPSHATLLTGRLPDETQVHDNAGFRLNPKVATLAERLKTHGFATAAAVSAYPMRHDTGLSRGFDLYDDAFVAAGGDRAMMEIQRSGMETTAAATKWLDTQKDGRAFLLLHLYEPHSPYSAPEPYRSRGTSAYDAEIAYVDSIVGTFLDDLRKKNLYDRATIVLLSDHGEGLGEHGEDEHGILLYRESLQVPLLVKLPGGDRKGTTIDAPAQLVDVFPTLLGLVGEKTPGMPGTSLLDLDAVKTPRSIFAETHFPSLHLGWSDLHSVISDRMHLIRGARTEFFDLIADPAEKSDVSSEHRRERSALDAVLAPRIVPVQTTTPISPEEARKLASLGYLGSTAASSGPLPDPRDHIAAFRQMREVTAHFEQHRYREAVEGAEALLQKYPNMIDVWELQADALAEAGQPAAGAAVARRGLTLNPSAVSRLAIRVADMSARAGKNEEARQHAELAMASSPAEAHAVLARVALAEKKLDLAAAEAQAAIDANPDRPIPYSLQGYIALGRNDPEGALAAFDRAAAVASRTNRPLHGLQTTRAVLLVRMKRDVEAEVAFRAELNAFPHDATAWRNLIIFLGEHQRVREARQLAVEIVQSHQAAAPYAIVAEALAIGGDREGAVQMVRAGLQRFPGHPGLTKMLR
jgi:choline-sulfatase